MVSSRKSGTRFYLFFIISNKNNVAPGGFRFFSILHKSMKFCCFGAGVRTSANAVFTAASTIL